MLGLLCVLKTQHFPENNWLPSEQGCYFTLGTVPLLTPTQEEVTFVEENPSSNSSFIIAQKELMDF